MAGMKLYSATIYDGVSATSGFGVQKMIFKAYSYPSAENISRCLRLQPGARIAVEYLGEVSESIQLVSDAGPIPVFAPGPGRASG